MSPTHSNKLGVRYRYYVSHAILQNRKAEAGSVARVPAPEIETLVCDSVRRHLGSMGEAELPTTLAERELIERHVARVIVQRVLMEGDIRESLALYSDLERIDPGRSFDRVRAAPQLRPLPLIVLSRPTLGPSDPVNDR
jgi:hypothetical protein